MKILIYTPYPPTSPGAAGMRVFYFQKAFEKATEKPVFIISPPSIKGHAITKAIFKSKPRIVIATSPPLPPTFWVWMGARISGARFILDAKEDGRAIQLMNKDNLSFKEILFLLLRRFIYTHADELWFLTEMDRAEAEKNYGIDPHRMRIVPNGTDERIQFNPAHRKKIRSIWKVSPSALAIVYAGTFGDEDLDGYIRAASILSSKKYFFVFALTYDKISSQTNQMSHFRTLIQSKLPHSTIYENVPVKEMSAILSGSDVGIIPWSNWLASSIPVKVFDYAGAGLPFVAKCLPGGELWNLIQTKMPRGETIENWSDFQKAFLKMTRAPLPPKQRLKISQTMQEKWSRKKIAEKIAEQTIHFFRQKASSWSNDLLS